MANQFIYMPVLRVRQEETKTLRTFDFGDRMYPCLEIVKEKDRDNNKKETFESFHLDLIATIQSKHVFVDIPLHLKQPTNTVAPVKTFMRQMTEMDNRNEKLLLLGPLSGKVIPVISSYFHINGKRGSFGKQEKALRPTFPRLAFRIFADSFDSDLDQVEPLARAGDFLIVDFVEGEIDFSESDVQDIQERLADFDACQVIIVRSAILNKITYPGLRHDTVCGDADNSLLSKFTTLNADAFGDYAGVKRDTITDGGAAFIPGFLYYNAVSNDYMGYRGTVKGLDEYGTVIVPDVIASRTTTQMRRAGFIGNANGGWKILKAMEAGDDNPRSAAKFKRIAIEHYLYCMREKISNGAFD
jgi:hypothetical protein